MKRADSGRGVCGKSRMLNDWLFRAGGNGRRGYGAFDAEDRMVATHPKESVLRSWYHPVDGYSIRKIETGTRG